jgi:hypothetical protein
MQEAAVFSSDYRNSGTDIHRILRVAFSSVAILFSMRRMLRNSGHEAFHDPEHVAKRVDCFVERRPVQEQ